MPTPTWLSAVLTGTRDHVHDNWLSHLVGAAVGGVGGYGLSAVDESGERTHAVRNSLLSGAGIGAIAPVLRNIYRAHPIAATGATAIPAGFLYSNTIGRPELPKHEPTDPNLLMAGGGIGGGLGGVALSSLLSDDPEDPAVSDKERAERHSRALRNALLLGALGAAGGAGAAHYFGKSDAGATPVATPAATPKV